MSSTNNDSGEITNIDIAAYLAGVRMLSQEQIAAEMDLNQSTVSRLLDKAVLAEKLARISPYRYQDKIMEEKVRRHLRKNDIKAEGLLTRINALELRCSDRIKEAQNKPLVRHVVICDTGGNSDSDIPSEWDEACRSFGPNALPAILDLLNNQHAEKIGVARGRQILSIAEAFAEKGVLTRRIGLQWFPVWSEPFEGDSKEETSAFFPDSSKISATYLAMLFSKVFNGTSEGVPRLRHLPMVLPKVFFPESEYKDARNGEMPGKNRRKARKASDSTDLPAEREVLFKFFHADRSYASVFGYEKWPRNHSREGNDQPALIREMDTALVGLGSSATPARHLSADVLYQLGIDEMELNRLIVGDIGGVILERSGLVGPHNPQQIRDRAQFEAILQRWTGMVLQDLQDCALRASRTMAPGIIICAIGRHRADTLLAAIRKGTVTCACIDKNLAVQLEIELSST